MDGGMRLLGSLLITLSVMPSRSVNAFTYRFVLPRK
jgi:hypothetical protein